jgi:predicted secreted protein
VVNPRLALAAVIATTLIGSLAGTASAQPAGGSSAPAVYHYAASGKTIVVKSGKTFKVSLEACGDCGARWSFGHRPASAILKVTGNKTVSDAKPGAVGGNDHQVFTFKAGHNGKTTMRLVERSAEKSDAVIKRFTLTVRVPETLVVD